MKKVILTLMLVMLSMTACGPKKDKAAINNIGREFRAGPGGSGWSNGEISQDGQVFHDNVDVFQDVAKAFVNASIPEEYLGYVGTGWDNQSDTGIFFGGRVSVSAGRFNASGGTQRVNVSSNSRVLITVWDEFAGQRDSNGKTIPAIPIYMTKATGWVQGNQADITFEDAYGWVRFEGNFNSQYFDGIISFDNAQRYDGKGRGGAGDLGYFKIRTCSFFLCN